MFTLYLSKKNEQNSRHQPCVTIKPSSWVMYHKPPRGAMIFNVLSFFALPNPKSLAKSKFFVSATDVTNHYPLILSLRTPSFISLFHYRLAPGCAFKQLTRRIIFVPSRLINEEAGALSVNNGVYQLCFDWNKGNQCGLKCRLRREKEDLRIISQIFCFTLAPGSLGKLPLYGVCSHRSRRTVGNKNNSDGDRLERVASLIRIKIVLFSHIQFGRRKLRLESKF